MPCPYKLGLNFAPGGWKLGFEQIMRHASDRFFARPTVKTHHCAGPKVNAPVKITRERRRKVKAGGLSRDLHDFRQRLRNRKPPQNSDQAGKIRRARLDQWEGGQRGFLLGRAAHISAPITA
jgi:hypothetical protein